MNTTLTKTKSDYREINRISITLREGGLKKVVSKFKYHKTSNSYIVNKESTFGGKTTRVKKDEILKPVSMVREDLYYIIHCCCWYFGDDLEAENICMDVIKSKAILQSETASKLLSYL